MCDTRAVQGELDARRVLAPRVDRIFLDGRGSRRFGLLAQVAELDAALVAVPVGAAAVQTDIFDNGGGEGRRGEAGRVSAIARRIPRHFGANRLPVGPVGLGARGLLQLALLVVLGTDPAGGAGAPGAGLAVLAEAGGALHGGGGRSKRQRGGAPLLLPRYWAPID